jgi:hypothetical protein
MITFAVLRWNNAKGGMRGAFPPYGLPVGPDQVLVRKGPLGIFIEELHVGVGGGAVQIEVIFFDVLAVIALRVGHPEEPLFEDGVLPVPQGQGQAEARFVIGKPGQAVLPPAIGPGAGLVMGKVIPGLAAGAVILPHRAPLAFTQVRPPFQPRNLTLPGFL